MWIILAIFKKQSTQNNYVQADFPLNLWVQNMNQLNNKKETKESGSLIKQSRKTTSEKRAAVATTSKTVNTKTEAMLGLNARVGTSKQVEPSSRKAKTLAAAGTKPGSQSMTAEQENMDMAKVSLLAVRLWKWPSFKVDDPTKARYAYLLRNVHLQPPTNEKLQEPIDCGKTVFPNFKL